MRYAITVYETATTEETTLNHTPHDATAIDLAEQEAERLAESLGHKLGTDATRYERVGWGRYLVWMPLGDQAEEAVYVVTVEAEAQDDE